MRNLLKSSRRGTTDHGRPDYYITPTRDFTKYTKDCEEKYWSKETAFDWAQDVQANLRQRLTNLDADSFLKIALITLPMVKATIQRKIELIMDEEIFFEEDALLSLNECISFDKKTIERALYVLSPLRRLHPALSALSDQVEIMKSELADLREQLRLGFIKQGIKVKSLETEAERQEQVNTLAKLNYEYDRLRKAHCELRTEYEVEKNNIRKIIQEELPSIKKLVVEDLHATEKLIQQTLLSQSLPDDPDDVLRLKDLVCKRQIRGLKDIANHALVVEQSAIAPLTVGIIYYKRHREIQQAMTTFINDEAKHSATFRRFLVEKLEAKEFISSRLIKGANRYLWLARLFPGVGLFFAVVVEAIGAAVLEFFGDEKYMPDQLFCSICKTITDQDEARHIGLCVDMYNELFRKGSRWEQLQNKVALRMLMKSVYGDKTEDNQLIQAFLSFGIESKILYQHIFTRVSQQLARISVYVAPEKIFEMIGKGQS